MPSAIESASPDLSFAAAGVESSVRPQEQAAWSTLPGGVIHDGEIVLLAIKPSMWRPLFESGAWLLGSAVLVAVLLIIARPLPGFSVAASLQLALFAGFGRLVVAIAHWIPRWHVLTNRRLIDVEGIRTPRIWSCPLIAVRNTMVSVSQPERLLRLGTITLMFQDESEQPRYWRSIAEAEEVHARLRRAIEDAIDLHGMST